MDDPKVIAAIVGVLTGLGGFITACTAYVKSKTTSTQGESMESTIKLLQETNKNQTEAIRELRETVKPLPTMQTKLDNDFRNIEKLKNDSQTQGMTLTALTQRVDTVEKLAEKVDKLTEIVISVKTLIENRSK